MLKSTKLEFSKINVWLLGRSPSSPRVPNYLAAHPRHGTHHQLQDRSVRESLNQRISCVKEILVQCNQPGGPVPRSDHVGKSGGMDATISCNKPQTSMNSIRARNEAGLVFLTLGAEISFGLDNANNDARVVQELQ